MTLVNARAAFETAIKNAVINKNQNSKIVNLIAPATPENILKSINNEI